MAGYPLEGLTPKIQALARYIKLANQSPLPMCAISALAGCTLAAQGLIKVKWRNAPASPVGMIFVVEALSGERKTSNDTIALQEHREFDKDQALKAIRDSRAHALAEAVWTKKHRKLLRDAAQSVDEKEDAEYIKLLKLHEDNYRPPPKHPRMLISDITAPAIALHLSEKYRYAGLVSDEGGVILNSGALSNPAMINSIWDYGNGVTDRMGRGRTEVYDASLTIYLQVQPGIFEHFLARQGNLAHAGGNSSRWLYANPRSTQGTRKSEDDDLPVKDKDAYNSRIREMLSNYEHSLPEQKIKTLTGAGQRRLNWFFQVIEKELAEGGYFALMRGAAAKAPENCARLAAVMHEFEGGISDEIDGQTIKGAIKIVSWHLNQYRLRFVPLTQMERDVQEVEDRISSIYPRWEKTNGYVEGPDLARQLPKRLRQIDKLFAILMELEAQSKVVVTERRPRGWSVVLSHWFLPVNRPAEGQKDERWARLPDHQERHLERERRAEAARAKEEVSRAQSEDGYKLWPGCYLRET
ncbi:MULTISPECIES: YfjI family protein [unclassified Variovorax]|uniref:YfjI family protein n=1 Tax=unclassified Variovorax TaxID=663243 RepID=UPI000B87B4FF|nr:MULTISPECIES: YfjI family protein [unclassified Variovorax]